MSDWQDRACDAILALWSPGFDKWSPASQAIARGKAMEFVSAIEPLIAERERAEHSEGFRSGRLVASGFQCACRFDAAGNDIEMLCSAHEELTAKRERAAREDERERCARLVEMLLAAARSRH